MALDRGRRSVKRSASSCVHIGLAFPFRQGVECIRRGSLPHCCVGGKTFNRIIESMTISLLQTIAKF
ncbi:hypothetical protein GCWU000325_02378 [Alloprevotella tannerae ATCC 51259]|uniref:Uncharacterized protein n=1 Tax=Alloprevotella tannerae ATCC 51259 TaxID=626522 RepID=C9LJG6_9BACT|nr:hypothetical protein GCWU000325_02378 [Alloprevotella tannerae ATCC 51259]